MNHEEQSSHETERLTYARDDLNSHLGVGRATPRKPHQRQPGEHSTQRGRSTVGLVKMMMMMMMMIYRAITTAAAVAILA